MAAAGQADPAERLDFLLSLLESLRRLDTGTGAGTARELWRLVSRECALVARGTPGERLLPLRRHISLLFGELIKAPEVNPEAARRLQQRQVRAQGVTRRDQA